MRFQGFVAEDKGVGLKGWLSGPRHPRKPTIQKLVPRDPHRIAVLPMINISPDPADAYFADGLTEELISTLSKISELSVISRTSVMRYRGLARAATEIGTELAVSAILEGSVRKAGEKLRITTQLIDTQSDKHLWSETYDRELRDIFAVQSDIATKIARSLRVALLKEDEEKISKKPTENMRAYALYLKGKTLLVSRTEADLKVAKELFESAIALDPAYAPAYSGLADAYLLLGDYSSTISPSTADRRAQELVSKALELNPDLAEARATLGLLLAQKYNFAGAEKELRRAISLNPSYSNAHNWLGQFVLAEQGRYRECLEELSLAELADPLSISVLNNEFTWLLLFERNLEQAALKLAKASQLYPGHTTTRSGNVLFHLATENYSRVIELSLEAIGHDESLRNNILLAWLVKAYAALGNREEARRCLARLETLPEGTPYKSVCLTLAHAGLGDANEFFVWARRAIEEKVMSLGHLRLIDREVPGTGSIRQDPRFTDLFKKVGLEA
jgi:TolB-like protein/Tfp pilus assembly protein PilF